jgi:signal peptidase II
MWFSDLNEYVGGFLHGRVVDMFYVDPFMGQLPEWLGGGYYSMPIWNFADACITVGIVVILIFQRRLFKDEAKQQAPRQEPHNPALVTETPQSEADASQQA